MKRMVFVLILGAITVTAPSAHAAGEHHPGMGHGPGEHWAAPAEAVKRPNPVARTPESVVQGRRIFEANCVSCHGPGGKGDGPAGKALDPKPTNLQAMAGQHTDGDFAWKIENGRGPMPPWKGVLTQEQIWHVVNYVQSLGPSKKGSAHPPHGDAHHKH